MRFIQGSRNYCTTDEHVNAPVFKAVFNCTFKYNNDEIKCANGINIFKL